VKRLFFSLTVGAFLCGVAIYRTEGFSPEIIETPWVEKCAALPSEDLKQILTRPFRYLGKGRQCFVFESGDFVLKFFNQKYLQDPWYAGEKEKYKRQRRRLFYEKSYEIAFREFGEEIAYLHLGPSTGLPKVTLAQAGREFVVDLNDVPFVLQRKGAPIYSVLEEVYQRRGLEGLKQEIDHFIEAVAKRVEKGIADADSDVEHNWGYVGGRLFHLDPGRLYYEEKLKEPKRLEREWHNATHGLHKWLKKNHPEAALYLENQIFATL
jgi:hypothetical protein